MINKQIRKKWHRQKYFLSSTQQILNDESQCMKWSDDGNSFIVVDREKLENEVLKKYYKHSNYQSFLRQLNNYGFLRTKNALGQAEFRMDKFTQQQQRIEQNLIKSKEIIEDFNIEFEMEHQQMKQELLKIQEGQIQIQEQLRQQIHKLTSQYRIWQQLTKILVVQFANVKGKIPKIFHIGLAFKQEIYPGPFKQLFEKWFELYGEDFRKMNGFEKLTKEFSQDDEMSCQSDNLSFVFQRATQQKEQQEEC